MSFQTAYWHWLVFGMLLILSELLIPNFTIVWFGFAAIVVSVLMLFVPSMSLTWQLFAWALSSCVLTFLWFRYIKPQMVDRTKAGIAREALIGQTAQVIKAPVEGRNGQLRFSVPMLGSNEWSFFCSETVIPGDRVVVSEISGNTLIVHKSAGS